MKEKYLQESMEKTNVKPPPTQEPPPPPPPQSKTALAKYGGIIHIGIRWRCRQCSALVDESPKGGPCVYCGGPLAYKEIEVFEVDDIG